MADKDEILVPRWERQEPYFHFPTGLRAFFKKPASSSKPWRIAPDDRSEPVHTNPATNRTLLHIHPNAIAVGGPTSFNKFWGGIIVTLVGGGGAFAIFWLAYLARSTPVFAAIVLVFGLLILLMTSWLFRFAFFTYGGSPAVLFDRKHRQVSFIPIRLPPLLKFWQGGTVGAAKTLAWDGLKVRGYRYFQAPAGQTARLLYRLSLVWDESDAPQQFAGYVDIGEEGWWHDDALWRLWEHIRRYMEEDGPPIRPGERLRAPDKRPEFPPEIIEAAGGPPLSDAEIAELTGVQQPSTDNTAQSTTNTTTWQ